MGRWVWLRTGTCHSHPVERPSRRPLRHPHAPIPHIPVDSCHSWQPWMQRQLIAVRHDAARWSFVHDRRERFALPSDSATAFRGDSPTCPPPPSLVHPHDMHAFPRRQRFPHGRQNREREYSWDVGGPFGDWPLRSACCIYGNLTKKTACAPAFGTSDSVSICSNICRSLCSSCSSHRRRTSHHRVRRLPIRRPRRRRLLRLRR